MSDDLRVAGMTLTEISELASAVLMATDDKYVEMHRGDIAKLCRAVTELLGHDGPEPLLLAYEAEIAANNALLDEIEARCTGSVEGDVIAISNLIKSRRRT